jgi:hypothetical protein
MRRPLAVAAVLAALAGLVALAGRLLNRPRRIARATIVDPERHTTIDARGAVRSIQAADLTLPAEEVERIWTPQHLERLARTYWRFLSRATLGLVRVRYTDTARHVVLVGRPFVLLSFRAPEYEMDERRGIVRWRIARGVLVAPAGREGDGYLEIDVQRCGDVGEGQARLHVEVEVANFYPMLASRVATWFYSATQSRIHVLITHGFLRSLARLDLAESRVGRFAPPRREDVPAPEEFEAAFARARALGNDAVAAEAGELVRADRDERDARDRAR